MAVPTPPPRAVVLVRADASESVGTGHVMRCLAFAQEAAARGIRVRFASARLTDGLRSRLEEEGFGVLKIHAPPGSSDDADETATASLREGCRWVVVDGYHFGRGYHDALRLRGLKVLAIDDFGRMGGHSADAILDQNLGADPSHYDAGSGAALLMGARFAMLRREFRAPGPARPRGSRCTVLVTMGGSDPSDATNLAVRALRRLEGKVDSTVVVGRAYPFLTRLRQEAQGTAIDLQVDPKDVAAWMGWADVAISAGGSTCWELALVGVPMILVPIADNQVQVAEALHHHGAGLLVGGIGRVTEERLAIEVSRLVDGKAVRARMAERCRTLVDGRGVERILEALARIDPSAWESRRLNAGDSD